MWQRFSWHDTEGNHVFCAELKQYHIDPCSPWAMIGELTGSGCHICQVWKPNAWAIPWNLSGEGKHTFCFLNAETWLLIKNSVQCGLTDLSHGAHGGSSWLCWFDLKNMLGNFDLMFVRAQKSSSLRICENVKPWQKPGGCLICFYDIILVKFHFFFLSAYNNTYCLCS